jgi:hypothetical protein
MRSRRRGWSLAGPYTHCAFYGGVNIGLEQLAHSIMDACIACEISTNVGPDHQEAIDAFKAKRPPKFRED